MKNFSFYFTKSAKAAQNPFRNVKYRQELDVTKYCHEKEHHLQHQITGILWWMIEVGHIGICMEVSIMSCFLVGTRISYLDQVLHIFSSLTCNQCMDICYDQTKLNITESTTILQQREVHRARVMCTMYPDISEDLPPDYPYYHNKVYKQKLLFIQILLRSYHHDSLRLKF